MQMSWILQDCPAKSTYVLENETAGREVWPVWICGCGYMCTQHLHVVEGCQKDPVAVNLVFLLKVVT